jgi:hypothetical protein
MKESDTKRIGRGLYISLILFLAIMLLPVAMWASGGTPNWDGSFVLAAGVAWVAFMLIMGMEYL